MRCRQVKALLPAHFNKELCESDRRALEMHLAACPSCYAHWRKLYRAELWLLQAAQHAQSKHGPSASFTASVLASIAARQQQSSAGQSAPSGASEAQQAVQRTGGRTAATLPPGSWFGLDASLPGIWSLSPRMMLSGALLVLVPVMVAVITLGILLTQPALATQAFVGVTDVLASVIAGLYSLLKTVSVLADNQLLLAGVAAGYVALALLWFRLMRHSAREEVES